MRMNNLKGKKVAVLGLGLEGKDLVKYLLTSGAHITVLDSKEEKDLDFDGIDKSRLNLVCGPRYLSALQDFEVIFRSPGVYRYKREIVDAEKSGATISSALKLFLDLCPAKTIGITGTKGKGTTSTLIYRILKASGKDVYLAGNIGKPLLELLPKLKRNSWVVMELSSFQLIDLDVSPHISVVLNITSDHMDWHKNQKEYIGAKENIVKHQKGSDFAVINKDYKVPAHFADLTKAKKFFFSSSKKVEGVYVMNGKIMLSESSEVEIGDVDKLLLRGKHNWENITAAVCASYLAGAGTKSIKKTVFGFKGLEHRLELVGVANERAFYNDSFATVPQPTIAALKSFTEPLTLILGGYPKVSDYRALESYIVRAQNITAVIVIGDLSDKLARELKKLGFDKILINMNKSPMAKIVQSAYENTPEGGVVLLSPAAASFDMFKDYKERGGQFKKAVSSLTNG